LNPSMCDVTMAEVVEVNGQVLQTPSQVQRCSFATPHQDSDQDPAEDLPLAMATTVDSFTPCPTSCITVLDASSSGAVIDVSPKRRGSTAPIAVHSFLSTTSNLLLLLGLLLVSACFPQGAMAEVISLTDATFEHQTQASTGATTGSWLVMFSIPSCESCKTLKLVLDGLSQDEAMYERGIVLGTVDCTESTAVCQRFSVTKLPTIAYLHKKQLYMFDTTTNGETEEEFPGKMSDQLKHFVLQGFQATEALPIPAPPSVMDAFMEPLTKLYEVGTDKPILGVAMVTLASMLFLTVLLLVYVLVRGNKTTTSATKSADKKKKTKKN
jgi:Thioredoxin